MPPASILSPGLDGKASPTRGLPTPTVPLGRKPNSPPPLGNAVRRVGPGARRLGQVTECPGVALKAVSATAHPRWARRCR